MMNDINFSLKVKDYVRRKYFNSSNFKSGLFHSTHNFQGKKWKKKVKRTRESTANTCPQFNTPKKKKKEK